MATAKVALSLPPGLLARIDGLAAAAGQSRSEFVRRRLEEALDALDEERAVREARAIYAEIEQDAGLRHLHDAFWSAARETVPPFAAAAEAAPSSGLDAAAAAPA